jgi:acetolactate synthase-1/2/3 large subunit
MAVMKGGELIAEYLVKQKVPYIFGICGHGNVGILDPLRAVRDRLKLVSPRHEQCAGHMADGYFASGTSRSRHSSTGPGSGEPPSHVARPALSDSSAFGDHLQRMTSQMNPAPFRSLPAQSGGLPVGHPPVVKRAPSSRRVDILPLALRQGFDTMVTSRPGP